MEEEGGNAQKRKRNVLLPLSPTPGGAKRGGVKKASEQKERSQDADAGILTEKEFAENVEELSAEKLGTGGAETRVPRERGAWQGGVDFWGD